MARYAGKNARVYMAITSAGTAEPLPFTTEWTLTAATDRYEGTAHGDQNKTYVSGLPDGSGSLSFFVDDSTSQTYTAAMDGLPRKFYLYPSTLDTSKYWYLNALVDFNMSVPVAGIASGTANWSAASNIGKSF